METSGATPAMAQSAETKAFRDREHYSPGGIAVTPRGVSSPGLPSWHAADNPNRFRNFLRLDKRLRELQGQSRLPNAEKAISLWEHDRPVVMTEDASRFPFPGLLPPDDQELGLAETLAGLKVAELVPALLDRAERLK